MARLWMMAALGGTWALDLYSCDFGANATVRFGSSEVACGTVMPYSTAHYWSTAPIIAYDMAVEDTLYAVAMVDPDAPSATEPTYREVRHYLVGNVEATTLRRGEFNASSVKVLSAFVNPAPPEGTGFHRYVQLIYEQPGFVAFGPVDASILNFNVTAFAAEYGLRGPVASNFFRTQYECSARNAQCGGGVNAESPIDCCDDDVSCFEQDATYYQCLPTCPEDWACNATDRRAKPASAPK